MRVLAFGTQGWVDPVRQMIFVLMIQRTGFGNSDEHSEVAQIQGRVAGDDGSRSLFS